MLLKNHLYFPATFLKCFLICMFFKRFFLQNWEKIINFRTNKMKELSIFSFFSQSVKNPFFLKIYSSRCFPYLTIFI